MAAHPPGQIPAKTRQVHPGWYLVIVLAIVSVSMAIYYTGRVVTRTGAHYSIVVPLAVMVAALWWLTAFFLPIHLVISARRRVLTNERYTLALAKESAAASGMEFRDGAITIWAYGPSDQIPMLREQIELVRARLSSLLGRSVEAWAPLRVYCFLRRDSLERYHRRLSLATGNTGGGYIPAPARIITISIEGVLRRLIEPEHWVRYLSGFYWLELDGGFLPPFWFREAVAYVLAASGDVQALARLNRRMIASLRSGRALDAAELFQVKEKALVKPVRNWADHQHFTRLSQWSPQSWSLGVFLFGASSTDERRVRSVAFLNDLKSSEGQEEIFMRHFGHGYDQLLEDWAKWVLEGGEGTHAPPPDRIRAILVNELIPTLQNNQLPLFERIQAIRVMGMEGYALGTSYLISLLRNGGDIPPEEPVWALESISGSALGNDPEVWTRWWQSVPEEARNRALSEERRETAGGIAESPE
jgi:hypothetical protein